jgi:hypothetical protein
VVGDDALVNSFSFDPGPPVVSHNQNPTFVQDYDMVYVRQFTPFMFAHIPLGAAGAIGKWFHCLFSFDLNYDCKSDLITDVPTEYQLSRAYVNDVNKTEFPFGRRRERASRRHVYAGPLFRFT